MAHVGIYGKSENYLRDCEIAVALNRAAADKKPGEGDGRLSRLWWYLKQTLPLTYWGIYSAPEGPRRLVIWKSWFGKTTVLFDHRVNV